MTERTISNEALRSKRNGSRSVERLRQSCQHRQISVQLDARESANAERREAVLVLQPSELALDGSALVVQVTEPLGPRGMSGWRRSALTHTLAGLHSPVGQRHLVACRP